MFSDMSIYCVFCYSPCIFIFLIFLSICIHKQDSQMTSFKISKLENDKQNKKYKAMFFDYTGKKLKTVKFGDDRYEDYTIHKDKKRREDYRSRHINDKINEPMTAGALSYWILWGRYTDINKNIKNYANKFGLKIQ